MAFEKTEKSIFDRLNILFFIVALSASVFAIIVLRGSSFIKNLDKLNQKAIAIEASNWDIPIFIALPCFIALIFALVLRLIDQDQDSRIRACINVALIFAAISIVVRIPYGYAVSNFLAGKNYSKCWEFSSPSMMSPTIWVKNSGYCIENSGSVRKEIIAWLDTLPNSGKGITPNDVRDKTQTLLETYDLKQREKYPELFR